MTKLDENKQAVVAVIIAIILTLGAIFVFVKSQQKNSLNESASTQKQMAETKTKDLKNIIKSGKNLQCNFEYFKNEDEQTAGVVYLSGDNLRFDATTSYGDKDSDIFLIRKGDTNYIWGAQLPKNAGLELNASIDELFANPQAQELLDPEKYEYSCQDWKIDSTAFNLPDDIKFTDLLGIMRLLATPSR